MSQYKQSAVMVVVLVVAALAACALSVRTTSFVYVDPANPTIAAVCDTCKVMAHKAQLEIPRAKTQVEMLCQLSGNITEIQTCVVLVDKAITQLGAKTPVDICRDLNLCPKV